MKVKHNQGENRHECDECGKLFNRKDNLQTHQSICSFVKYKCPRCHRIMRSMEELTRHMGLCPTLECSKCGEPFVELNQLRQHEKTHSKKTKNKDDFHCRVCMQSFPSRQTLFSHKLRHMEDPTPYQPVQPHFDYADEKLNDILRQNADFIFSHHKFSPVSALYNFPLYITLNRDGWINEIYHILELLSNMNNDECFKFNISMGFVLVNRETNEYRYFVPHTNNAFFKMPIRIERPSSWKQVYSQMPEESLKNYVTNHRQDTKWIPLMITNIVCDFYFLGISLGAGELPQFIKQKNCIISMEKDRHNRLYDDKKCALRCLAFHLNHKDTGNGYCGLEKRTEQLAEQWEEIGLDLMRVPQFEKCFNISVDIYSLCQDGSVIPRYLSEELYPDKIVLNLWDRHLSYVTDVQAYLQKYCCDSCQRHFKQLSDWKRHLGSCANATKHEFPGGFHKMSPSIFERLEEFNIVVPLEKRLYHHFIVYDFEAVLSHIKDDQTTKKLKWLRRHDPISVSVASNVDGFESAKCFVNSDPKKLIQEMMGYMGSIADAALDAALSKWSYARAKLEGMIEAYEKKLGKDPRRKRDAVSYVPPPKQQQDNETVDSEWRGINEEGKKSVLAEWGNTLEKLYRLEDSLYHYCRQIPVLGFNSARYDLNLAKSHLIPWLRADVDPEKKEYEDTTQINVIKKGSAYTQIGARRFKFIDISNYLAGGVSYSAFLKAYNIKETKSYFPYEWFDHPSKLDHPCLPDYKEFYSELRQKKCT